MTVQEQIYTLAKQISPEVQVEVVTQLAAQLTEQQAYVVQRNLAEQYDAKLEEEILKGWRQIEAGQVSTKSIREITEEVIHEYSTSS